jgi:hypothetical protein
MMYSFLEVSVALRVLLSVLLVTVWLTSCKLTDGVSEATLMVLHEVPPGQEPACPFGIAVAVQIEDYQYLVPPVAPGGYWVSYPVYPEYGLEFSITVSCYQLPTESKVFHVHGVVPLDPHWKGIIVTTNFEGRNCQNEETDLLCIEF